LFAAFFGGKETMIVSEGGGKTNRTGESCSQVSDNATLLGIMLR